jgi:hypothetical protein
MKSQSFILRCCSCVKTSINSCLYDFVYEKYVELVSVIVSNYIHTIVAVCVMVGGILLSAGMFALFLFTVSQEAVYLWEKSQIIANENEFIRKNVLPVVQLASSQYLGSSGSAASPGGAGAGGIGGPSGSISSTSASNNPFSEDTIKSTADTIPSGDSAALREDVLSDAVAAEKLSPSGEMQKDGEHTFVDKRSLSHQHGNFNATATTTSISSDSTLPYNLTSSDPQQIQQVQNLNSETGNVAGTVGGTAATVTGAPAAANGSPGAPAVNITEYYEKYVVGWLEKNIEEFKVIKELYEIFSEKEGLGGRNATSGVGGGSGIGGSGSAGDRDLMKLKSLKIDRCSIPNTGFSTVPEECKTKRRRRRGKKRGGGILGDDSEGESGSGVNSDDSDNVNGEDGYVDGDDDDSAEDGDDGDSDGEAGTDSDSAEGTGKDGKKQKRFSLREMKATKMLLKRLFRGDFGAVSTLGAEAYSELSVWLPKGGKVHSDISEITSLVER